MDSKFLDIFPEDNLLKRFEEINDYIYANEGLSSQQTLNEFLKILFIKIFDEKKGLEMFYITLDELKSIKKENKRSSITERVNKLFNLAKKEFPNLFEKSDYIKLSPSTLGFIINKLQILEFNESKKDVKGLAFQKFLSHSEKIGKGQFFTPQPVIDFCVKIIDPKYNETVIDPCCGSGGFIYSAFQHMTKDCSIIQRQKIIREQLYGIDINKDIALISKMKLLLEENVSNNIFCANSLADIDLLKLTIDLKKDFEGFDVLLTNPPFGSAGKITDFSLLKSYNLGYKWKETEIGCYKKTDNVLSGQPAEILFIDRCLDLLKEGGRMAIILPNGHLENPSLEYLRYYIKQRAQILAVINLPQETFIPYGTGVKTSILFLKKTSNPISNYVIFFSKITKLGYQGNKNATPIYKKDVNGNYIIENGKYVLEEDFSNIIKDYESFKTQQPFKNINSYSISNTDLKGRIDYDFYTPALRSVLDNIHKQSVRLGDIVSIVKVRSPKLKNKEKIVEYVELSDINTHSFEIINSSSYAVHELPSRATFELKEGDIITGIAGNSVGTKKHATALVTHEHDGAICTNGFRVLRSPKINPYYLLFYLHSDLFLKQMMMYRTGAAIPNVSDSDLFNIRIYMPSFEKMEEIGNKIKRTFELRNESRRIIETINLM